MSGSTLDTTTALRAREARSTSSASAYSGGYGTNSATPGAQGNITDNDPDQDRPIDIIASVEPPKLAPGQQWLEMSPATTVIIVRNFFLDREHERSSELEIECLNPPTEHPARCRPTSLPPDSR